MLNRVALNFNRLAIARPIARHVHKGVESTPPMRFISIPQKLGLYFAIAISFLSYPTYVMMNLDNMRPKAENSLGESALATRELRLASRT